MLAEIEGEECEWKGKDRKERIGSGTSLERLGSITLEFQTVVLFGLWPNVFLIPLEILFGLDLIQGKESTCTLVVTSLQGQNGNLD